MPVQGDQKEGVVDFKVHFRKAADGMGGYSHYEYTLLVDDLPIGAKVTRSVRIGDSLSSHAFQAFITIIQLELKRREVKDGNYRSSRQHR